MQISCDQIRVIDAVIAGTSGRALPAAHARLRLFS